MLIGPIEVQPVMAHRSRPASPPPTGRAWGESPRAPEPSALAPLVGTMAMGLAWLLVPGASLAQTAMGTSPVQPAFNELRPRDWSYQALHRLDQEHPCLGPQASPLFEAGRPISRQEAAVLLRGCLRAGPEATDALLRLRRELAPELAEIQGQADALEARLGELEATRFAPVTRLIGQGTFVLGANGFSGGNQPLVHTYQAQEGGTTFSYDLRLNFDTSFSGKDLLRAQLRAGNFASSGFGNLNGLNELEVAYQTSCGFGNNCTDVVGIYRLFYQFPLGPEITLTVGPRIRQDDGLALWPSVYPADTILDVFSYAGAPGAYDTNLGAGMGLWWKHGGWSVSAEYLAANADRGSPREGGLFTAASGATATLQLGYGADAWALAAVYTWGNAFPGAVYPGSATPLAALNASDWPALAAFGSSGDTQSVGLSGYWQPAGSAWWPSISSGWGLNVIRPGNPQAGFGSMTSQSWFVGLQWSDALVSGNSFGLAVGQPTFITGCGGVCSRLLGQGNDTPRDGQFAWEGWYKWQVSDAISVTPALFYLSSPYGAIDRSLARQQQSGSGFQNLGALVKTTFHF